ncbi:MAG: hypothetical protein XD53_1577 [Petrotoga mobilis]|nr:MAG: hypothetical protein XD53_1577 [Petrotoga mobilis]
MLKYEFWLAKLRKIVKIIINCDFTLKKMLEKREHLCYNLYAQMEFIYFTGSWRSWERATMAR